MYFATLLDQNYIPRADVMIESLVESMGTKFSKIFVLCLDQNVTKYFQNNRFVETIPLFKLEGFFPELVLAKSNRSFVEYIFTLSPFLPFYILKNYPLLKRVTSLDSDLYFFSSPSNILESLGDNKIGITAHNFPDELKHLDKFGKYNVSFQSFPNTEVGIKCLRDWADDCIRFCGDFLDDKGRFADQKYLDIWQDRYGLVVAFPSAEIGLAPWNVHSFHLDFQAPNLILNGEKVIFYHFQGLRIKSNNRFLLGLTNYLGDKRPSKNTLAIYKLYITKLLKKSKATDGRIKRLQTTSSKGFQSLVDDLRVQPVLFRVSSFTKYLDFRKVIDFAEKKLKITQWQN